jgi:ABC-type multidrug transport system, ATPase component
MNECGVIEAHNINKFFGSFQALKDLSISVPQGDIFGFIGRNGAGKTTFMRIICGLMKPDSGTLKVKKNVGFLPQNVRFFDKMVAEEAIRFYSGLRDSAAEEGLGFAGELDVDLTKKVKDLSPGQQRKLQLVIATIGLPEILVLDEPTAGLDPSGVQQVREIINTLHRKGCTVFISSHVLMELDNLCGNVAIIEKGQLLYQGGCSTVYEIETEGMDEYIIGMLPEEKKRKCRVSGEMLIAGIVRSEVPEILQLLYEKNVKVFSVKRQGLERLYNNLLKEGT